MMMHVCTVAGLVPQGCASTGSVSLVRQSVGSNMTMHACSTLTGRNRAMRAVLSLLCLLAAAVPASCAGPALPSGYRLPNPSGRESPQTVCL